LEDQGIPLWNSPSLVRWNIDKRYLLDLEANGIPIIPTAFLEAGTRLDIGRELASRGWPSAVVKPAVSASANRTAIVEARNPAAAQAAVDALLATGACLLQPFMPEVVETGEWSCAFFDGQF